MTFNTNQNLHTQVPRIQLPHHKFIMFFSVFLRRSPQCILLALFSKFSFSAEVCKTFLLCQSYICHSTTSHYSLQLCLSHFHSLKLRRTVYHFVAFSFISSGGPAYFFKIRFLCVSNVVKFQLNMLQNHFFGVLVCTDFQDTAFVSHLWLQ